jgi:hypothetical protein
LLLRLSFLEPTFERQDLLIDNPPDAMIVLPRYSFTGDGKSDSVTCAWMVWGEDIPYDGHGIFIQKKHRKNKKASTILGEFY